MAGRTALASIRFCTLPLRLTLGRSLVVGLALTCPCPAIAQEAVDAKSFGDSRYVAADVDPIEASIKTIGEWPVAQVGEHGIESAEFIFSLKGRPTPECHASTIVDTSEGLVAAWFGGLHENHPGVGIWVSRHDGTKWSEAVEVVDGSEGEDQEYACWNPVLFQPRGGPLWLFYKVGVSPSKWWGAATTSKDNGRTWSQPWRLGTSPELFIENRSLLGPVKNKPLQLSSGRVICPSSTENQGWRVHFENTNDILRGPQATWTVVGPLQVGEKLDAIQPSVLEHADGRLQIVCRTRQGVVGTSWSSDSGESWGPMKSLKLPNPNSGTDAITLTDGRHLLVYNHSRRSAEANGRHILNVAISDDGVEWKPLMSLENHNDSAGYSYPAVIQAGDGRVHITYTWRRLAIKHVVLDPQQL